MPNIDEINSQMSKIIIYQRFLAKFRYGLFEELSEQKYLDEVRIIATKGMNIGSQKGYIPTEKKDKLNIDIVKSISKVLHGKRTVFIPFYPNAFFKLKNADIIVLEGTSNLLNSIFLVPIAKIFGKKIIWWDAGFNGDVRTLKRKTIDSILRFLIRQTYAQMAYSTLAKEYMVNYLNAKNCFCNINTISTRYFETKYDIYKTFINKRIESLVQSLNLIYVGAIEKRKELHTLISLLEGFDKKIIFTIIGDGNYKDDLMKITPPNNVELIFKPSSYDFSFLEDYYLNSHLFMMPGEGGLSIIQSMQFDTPVIAIKADGTELDYINSGEDGFICSSIMEFKEKIEEFLAMPPNKRVELYLNTLDKAKKIGSKQWCRTFIEKVL